MPPSPRAGAPYAEGVDLAERVKQIGIDAGLADVRVASAEPFDATRRHIEERKGAGYFGAMRFTTARPDISTNPAAAVAGARSLVVGAYGYWRPDPDPPDPNRLTGRIGRLPRALRSR